MIPLIIPRNRTGKDGTFGELQDDKGDHLFFTVEPEWLNNTPFKSCVPPGWYDTEWYDSPKHGYSLQLINVLDDRKYCQVHSANWFFQLLGCIALGSSIRSIWSKEKEEYLMGVSSSRASIKAFNEKYGGKKIRLIIENRF